MDVSKFNEEFPVGSDVIYMDDVGREHETKTTSEAWELGHGDAVVKINGKRGGHCIDRIRKPNKAVKSIETIASLEEKGEKMLVESAVSVTTDQTNVVSVQYPEKPNYTLTAKTIKALAKEYAHLKQLDIKDKAAYEELTDAIKIVSTHRIDNDKEEKAIKKPLNAFKNIVGEIGKKLRSDVSVVEDALKAEKKRIDDIVAEELAAQQRLWTENLNLTIQIAQNLHGKSLERLHEELSEVESFNLHDYDFGDQLEQAKANVASSHSTVKQAIAMEEQRIKLEEEAAENRRIAAEAEAKRKQEVEDQAEKDRITAEEKAAQDKKIADLEAKLAAANAPKEPEPEPAKTEEPTEKIPEEEKTIGGYPTAAPKRVLNGDRTEEAAQCGFSEEEVAGENDVTVFPEYDVLAINALIDDMHQCVDTHNNLELKTEEATAYVTKVTGQLSVMAKFLNEKLVEHSL